MNNSFNTRYILVKRPNTHKFSVTPIIDEPFLTGNVHHFTTFEDIVEFIDRHLNDTNVNINVPKRPSPKVSRTSANPHSSLDSFTEGVNTLKSLKRKRHDLDREITEKEDALMKYIHTLYPQYGESIYSIIQEIINR